MSDEPVEKVVHSQVDPAESVAFVLNWGARGGTVRAALPMSGCVDCGYSPLEDQDELLRPDFPHPITLERLPGLPCPDCFQEKNPNLTHVEFALSRVLVMTAMTKNGQIRGPGGRFLSDEKLRELLKGAKPTYQPDTDRCVWRYDLVWSKIPLPPEPGEQAYQPMTSWGREAAAAGPTDPSRVARFGYWLWRAPSESVVRSQVYGPLTRPYNPMGRNVKSKPFRPQVPNQFIEEPVPYDLTRQAEKDARALAASIDAQVLLANNPGAQVGGRTATEVEMMQCAARNARDEEEARRREALELRERALRELVAKGPTAQELEEAGGKPKSLAARLAAQIKTLGLL